MLSSTTLPTVSVPATSYSNMQLSRRPYFDNKTILLKNGTAVHLRQIRSCDANLIYEIYRQMSDDSRYLRFNSYLTDSLCRKFAEITAVQCEKNGFGVLAYVLDDACPSGIRPLGIAYYVQQGNSTPELALSIIDTHHNLGLGTKLFSELLQAARRARLAQLEAYVLPSNIGMRLLIQRAGKPFYYGKDGSYETYRIVV